MSPVSELGTAGFTIFWSVTALAVGIFSYCMFQLLRNTLGPVQAEIKPVSATNKIRTATRLKGDCRAC